MDDLSKESHSGGVPESLASPQQSLKVDEQGITSQQILEVFGEHTPLARAYADLLCTVALPRGFIGPSEVAVIWQRHLLNCAPLAQLIPAGSTVCDVGSGAGLPGIVIALMRPDVQVTCLDSMAKRCLFLEEVAQSLSLENVAVVHSRAQQYHDQKFDVVTARAVARMDALILATHHLITQGGELVALKGENVVNELARVAADPKVSRLGRCRLQELTDAVGQRLMVAQFSPHQVS